MGPNLPYQRTATTDADIRSALHAKRLRRLKDDPNTLVIDELGLAHARSRIDIAVINGCIHGYEIKSEKDTLERLGMQVDIYRQTLQKLTIVSAPRHLAGVARCAPEWCGLIEAEQGPRGGIGFNVVRAPRLNPDIDPVMVAHLLWRDEVLELLRRIDCEPKDLRRPRKQIYRIVCEALSLYELITAIRTFMTHRQGWRDRPALALCGD